MYYLNIWTLYNIPKQALDVEAICFLLIQGRFSISSPQPNENPAIVLRQRLLGCRKDLHKAGLMSAQTMAEFDALCLPPVKQLSASEIKKLRRRFAISQPVFAAYLNTSPNTIKQWEQGVRKPNSIALKLLNLVDHKGLEILAY